MSPEWLDVLRGPDTLGKFSAIFCMRDKFCNFLFAHKAPSKKMSSLSLVLLNK